MAKKLTFTVAGKPQSTARPRVRAFVDKTGKARGQAYMPKTTQFAHQAVRDAAQRALSTNGTRGWPVEPVRVTVEARFAYPNSTAKKRLIDGAPMTQRPDVENLAKTVLDGCTGVVWKDDAQVAELLVRKVRVVDPFDEGFSVEIEELSNDHR